MENASKALIIAGAILLSILIISLGIMIFGQASGVIDNNSMTELEITTFNDKFSQYFGTKVRGANVNALLNAVKQNNLAADDESRKITVNSTNIEPKISVTTAGVISGSAQTGKTYKVEVPETNGYTTGGLIHTISITAN